MKNRIENNNEAKWKLAGAIQDMWHYATVIVPINGAESTFLSQREYRGLPGLIHAYESLFSKVAGWQISELPAFESLDLISPEYINTTGELRHQVRKIFKAIETVADANNIDGYTGTYKS